MSRLVVAFALLLSSSLVCAVPANLASTIAYVPAHKILTAAAAANATGVKIDWAALTKPHSLPCPAGDPALDISPVLRHALHAAASPSSPVIIAEFNHRLTRTHDGGLTVASATLQHRATTWKLADALVALQPSSLDCTPESVAAPPNATGWLRLRVTPATPHRTALTSAVDLLAGVRRAVYGAHLTHAAAMYSVPDATATTLLPSYATVLRAATSVLAATGTPFLFDDAALAALHDVPHGCGTLRASLPSAFVVEAGSSVTPSTGGLDLILRPLSQLTDVYASGEVKFGTLND